ncbi:MAG: TonB-dependent receptor plug domain-containing protein [Henriciella sp.]
MSGYRKLLASAAIATLLSAAIDPVFAQTEADSIDGDLSADTGRKTLQTIMVTAQKRSEDIQDVPIVISAFSEDQIAAFGASTLEELPNYIAGVELLDERGAGQPTWIIRGVGLVDFNANNAPTASIFDDEVYLGSNVLGGLGLFDLERVEVLKGAQGGLYGRNTTGGAVRYIPHTPVSAPLYRETFRQAMGVGAKPV